MTMERITSVVLLVGLGGAVLWGGHRAENSERQAPPDVLWLEQNETQLRRIFNMPVRLGLAFKERRESPIPDFDVVVLEILRGDSRQPFEVYVSSDGQRIIYDRLYDLRDPFAEIREQINLSGVPARGPADAPVTIVEYSDFTCGFCRRFVQTLGNGLIDRYDGKVRHVFKHFPLVGLRRHAQGSAVAAACAFRQGNDAFWAMHAQLFENAEILAKGKPALLRLAEQAKLDLAAFGRCLESQDSLPDVTRDQEEGMQVKVEGTPTFFINGRPVPGLPSPEYFDQIIAEELAFAERR